MSLAFKNVSSIHITETKYFPRFYDKFLTNIDCYNHTIKLAWLQKHGRLLIHPPPCFKHWNKTSNTNDTNKNNTNKKLSIKLFIDKEKHCVQKWNPWTVEWKSDACLRNHQSDMVLHDLFLPESKSHQRYSDKARRFRAHTLINRNRD